MLEEPRVHNSSGQTIWRSSWDNPDRGEQKSPWWVSTHPHNHSCTPLHPQNTHTHAPTYTTTHPHMQDGVLTTNGVKLPGLCETGASIIISHSPIFTALCNTTDHCSQARTQVPMALAAVPNKYWSCRCYLGAGKVSTKHHALPVLSHKGHAYKSYEVPGITLKYGTQSPPSVYQFKNDPTHRYTSTTVQGKLETDIIPSDHAGTQWPWVTRCETQSIEGALLTQATTGQRAVNSGYTGKGDKFVSIYLKHVVHCWSWKQCTTRDILSRCIGPFAIPNVIMNLYSFSCYSVRVSWFAITGSFCLEQPHSSSLPHTHGVKVYSTTYTSHICTCTYI